MNNLDLTIEELRAIAELLEAKTHEFFEDDSDYDVVVSAAKKIDFEIERIRIMNWEIYNLLKKDNGKP